MERQITAPEQTSSHVIRSIVNNDLRITPTGITPGVNFLKEKKYLLIKGRSCPDDAMLFYSRIYKSLDHYFNSGSSILTVYISLEYFNTSSAKCLFGLFKKLQENSNQSEMTISVNWYYESDDADMLEAGEDFSDFFNYNFNLVPMEPQT